MDKALRVWNFQDKSSELISFFDDAPLAVSLHPSGLYLLVSFGEKASIKQKGSFLRGITASTSRASYEPLLLGVKIQTKK